ncbi:MAG: HD domain-containing protein [Proteobacteria bacterium]|nr:HD domain-containing protein [Pseudomonadota bacterium]MBU1641325.1 HD domain-containing protein [Pseudomonadota bacterium]
MGESYQNTEPKIDLPIEDDHYSEHLASVNEDNSVVATEDICNGHGAILVKKGGRISAAVSGRILKHKLLKPIEDQVKLERQLDSTNLSDHARALFAKYPDLGTIHEALNSDPFWQSIIKEYQLPAILWQKLTVMQHQIPQDYEKSIFCAWLSVVVGREMKLRDDEIESLYVAGLTHDIGLLHIDPAIINKKGPLAATEWRAIQSHVLVGKLMVENIRGVKPSVAQAILDHHERCDGTGYPSQKAERNLHTLGLIIGITDSLQAIRVKQFAPVGRNMMDALPYLSMNAHTYSYPVYQAMHNILRRSGLKPTTVKLGKEGGAFLGEIITRAEKLKLIMPQLGKVQEILQEMAHTMRGKDLLRALERVDSMVDSSGLLKEELLSWLRTIDGTPDLSVMGELVEMDLMLNELKWQLSNLLHAFNRFCEQDDVVGEDSCDAVKAVTATLLANMP